MLRATVRKQLGEFVLDLDIECHRRVTGLFGPSGSGKTTLLNCLTGVSRPDSGRIQVGETIWFDAESGIEVPVRRRRVGYVFQESLLFDHMTVLKNITYGQKSGTAGPRLEDVVRVLEIESLMERKPRELSGGQQQRVAVARALLCHPTLLLFDEPLTGLDVGLAGRVLVYLKRVLDVFEIPTVYVSHSISDIVYLCDEVVVLQDGRVAIRGAPAFVVTHRNVLDERHLAELQNIFIAEVLAADADEQSIRCRLGENNLVVYGSFEDTPKELTLAIHACDIMLATQRPEQISARNALAGIVEKVEPAGSKVLVFVNVGISWMVEVGRAAVKELNLQPGAQVYAIIKATAVRVL